MLYLHYVLGVTVEHLDQLYQKLSIHCSPKWRTIGIQLGFRPDELDSIKVKASPGILPPNCFFHQMLAEWLHWSPGDLRGSTGLPTLEDLKSALVRAGFGVIAATLDIEN